MKAICLLSGGLDSTVTLAYALHRGFEVTALTINYGQRHKRELDAAKAVAAHYKVPHIIMQFPLTGFRSALTDESIPVPDRKPEEIGYDIPETYVPARNIVFLSLAAGLAESVDASAVFIGANAIDYSGYPDCRPEFFQAFEDMLEVGTKRGVLGHPVRIEHPILKKSKAEIVKMGLKLGAPLHLTWSCYRGGEKACGHCDSCVLRLKGFKEARSKDPVPYEG
ncbi:MAG: 7-cyano-7-deazaguanine synthase QueC [Methanomassiliicoccales archaeon]|jgi:7-cyano-7-deazaguanine synthase|nr:7-cyano-7-deazaguanine synthase QueC [Methanomassiliicoccales archaeon]